MVDGETCVVCGETYVVYSKNCVVCGETYVVYGKTCVVCGKTCEVYGIVSNDGGYDVEERRGHTSSGQA